MSGPSWDTFRRAEPGQSDDDWIEWLTDDELDVLVQVAQPAICQPIGRDRMTQPEPLPRWAAVVVRRVRTQARWRRRKALRQQLAETETGTSSASVAVDPAAGFKAWLHSTWPSAPESLRRSLATMARALGVSVPRERRSRSGNASAAADALSPLTAMEMHSHPKKRSAFRSRIGAKVSAAVRSVVQSVAEPVEPKARDIPAEPSAPEARESDWTAIDSLRNALRGDDRDWH